ncbi:MAG TPA: hypothetical protein VHC22_10010 [Pirellulales bacterium]|nr:hypothetical protein [Pirellulales bacterium]
MSVELDAVSDTSRATDEKKISSKHFRASVGLFDDPAARGTIDELAIWVAVRFSDDLRKRPSKHVYISTLPDDIVQKIDRLRDSETIHSQIMRQFSPSNVLIPMKHTDELYISHYNKDFGGDQGLFSKHYDGNMRFLSFGSVVRALIYVRSDATYKVVFGDSGVEKAFVTYDFGLLDFHRELHWVEGEYNPNDQQRVLLKCNYLIVPANAGWLGQAIEAANTGVFYVVKAAMEYSKSPSNPLQYAVGFFCNLFRLMNNVHPLVPMAFLLLVAGGCGAAIVGLVR